MKVVVLGMKSYVLQAGCGSFDCDKEPFLVMLLGSYWLT